MKRDLAAFRVSQKQETVTEERNRSRRIQRTRFSATLNDAAGQQRVEGHGEGVDGSTAGFGNILGVGTPRPGKQKGRGCGSCTPLYFPILQTQGCWQPRK